MHVTTNENEQKLNILNSVLELKSPDKDLRKSIVDHILDEWHVKFDDNYMRADVINRIFMEQKDYNKENSGIVAKLETQVKNIQSEYILAETVEEILKGYVEVEEVDELRNQMKQMPTLSAMEMKLRHVTDIIEETKTMFKNKYVKKSYME